MAIPNNAIAGLPLLKWRGLNAPPYAGQPIPFSHSQAQRRYPYIDGAGHDWTGFDPLQLPFKLFFLNTLGTNLFPELWEQWREALFDGSADDLEHPLLGPVRAVVMKGSIDWGPMTRAGTIVEVTFEQHIDDPSEALKFKAAKVNIKTLAAAADVAHKKLGIEYPTGQRTNNLLDFIKQIEGELFSLRLSANGMVNQMIGIVEGLITSVRNLQSVESWPALDLTIRLHVELLDLADKIASEAARTVATRLITAPTTLSTIAEETGNTFGDLLTLNEELLGAPRIKVGSTVSFYKD